MLRTVIGGLVLINLFSTTVLGQQLIDDPALLLDWSYSKFPANSIERLNITGSRCKNMADSDPPCGAKSKIATDKYVNQEVGNLGSKFKEISADILAQAAVKQIKDEYEHKIAALREKLGILERRLEKLELGPRRKAE